jgi:cellulose synthase/poly-beta-1,6-N-acetylglucosamine synthase-like glycosyltransferase
MDLKILLFLLYVFFIAGIFWAYGGYLIFIIILSKIFKKKYTIDEFYNPAVTIIIPTYNEETVIKGKLENIISQDYPKEKMQILVVDSASTDKTREIVINYAKDGIELIKQEERIGKGAAIKYALEFTKNDIVVITDANAYFEPNALKYLLRNFSDPKVGGVTGRYCSKDIKGNAESKGTVFFREYENILRRHETEIDSAVSLFGEIFACRKNILFLDENNLTEDLDSSISIREKGYRLAYEPKAEVYEYAPSTREDLIMQRKSVITGTIQTLWKHRYSIFNFRYGFYGTMILPSHKLLPVLSPIFLIGFLSLSIVILKDRPFIIFCLFILLAIMLLLSLFFKRILSPFLKLIKYIILVNIACLLAWKNYLTGNYTVKWTKMKSSRYL